MVALVDEGGRGGLLLLINQSISRRNKEQERPVSLSEVLWEHHHLLKSTRGRFPYLKCCGNITIFQNVPSLKVFNVVIIYKGE
jgi:hypothetical protein